MRVYRTPLTQQITFGKIHSQTEEYLLKEPSQQAIYKIKESNSRIGNHWQEVEEVKLILYRWR